MDSEGSLEDEHNDNNGNGNHQNSYNDFNMELSPTNMHVTSNAENSEKAPAAPRKEVNVAEESIRSPSPVNFNEMDSPQTEQLQDAASFSSPLPSPSRSLAHHARSDSEESSDLDPESDVLAPVQRQIEEQLRRQLYVLSTTYREHSNEAKIVKQRRETVGVELYNVQQSLARLQESMEKSQDNLFAIQKLRAEKESEKQQLQAQLTDAERIKGETNTKVLKFQNELDKLNETLHNVEEFNVHIQSEIEIERRAAYKVEDSATKIEQSKIKQDLQVDMLSERVKSLTEQKASLAAQLDSQKAETRVARDTLAEASSEMEAISFEKKQLMQQWKASLVGMERRDNAVRITEEALNEQKQKLMNIDNEIIGYRKSIKVSQAEKSKLETMLSHSENEIGILDKQIEAMTDRKQKAMEKYALLKNALQQADSKKKKLMGETRLIAAEVTEIAKKSLNASKEVINLEEKMMKTLSDQTTLKKNSLGALQDIEHLKDLIREKEIHITQMENELAGINMDMLQTEGHNEVLLRNLGELEKELHYRESLIESMKTEIRRKYGEIDRRKKQLDTFDRIYDALMMAHSSEEDKNTGPLEATINSLSKQITQVAAENNRLQSEWIRLQTELVTNENVNSALADKIKDLKSRITILTNKKDRFVQQTQKERMDISGLAKEIQSLHLEMQRTNDLITKNTQGQDQLANDAYVIETDLVARLKEKKREAIKLEKKVNDIQGKKSDLINEILDSERNIMFWEKKIQLAKETELALDPNVGREEITRMQKEIYIMEQRLTSLRRAEKRKIEAMQKQIDMRDILRMKGEAIEEAAKKNRMKGVTKLTIGKENTKLAMSLNEKKLEARQKEKQIQQSLANTEKAAVDIEKTTNNIEIAQKELYETQERLRLKELKKKLVLAEKERKQRSLHRIREAQATGHIQGLSGAGKSMEEIVYRKSGVEKQREALISAINELKQQYPQCAMGLQEIANRV